MSSSSSSRGWWWTYFDENSGVGMKIEAAYANFKEKRSKVMCKQCEIAQIIHEQQQDHAAHQQGSISVVCTQEQITEWSLCGFVCKPTHS